MYAGYRHAMFPRRHPGSYWLPVTFLSIHPRRATAPHNTQKKQERFFARSQRNGKKGGDFVATSLPNRIKLAAAAGQWDGAAWAGARTRPRPRFTPAFYLLLRGTARATGVWCARSLIFRTWSPPWTQRRPRAKWAAPLGAHQGWKRRRQRARLARRSCWRHDCRCRRLALACWARCRWCTTHPLS